MARRMLEYIKEQPEVWRKITDDRESLFQGAVEKLQQPVKRIVILGSGSSYIASMAAADFYGKMLGLEAAAVVPTRLDGLLRLLNPDETLLIAVSVREEYLHHRCSKEMEGMRLLHSGGNRR